MISMRSRQMRLRSVGLSAPFGPPRTIPLIVVVVDIVYRLLANLSSQGKQEKYNLGTVSSCIFGGHDHSRRQPAPGRALSVRPAGHQGARRFASSATRLTGPAPWRTKWSTAASDQCRARVLEEYPGRYSLVALTPETVSRFRDDRLREGKSPSTVRLELVLQTS